MSDIKRGRQSHLIGKKFGRLLVIDFDDWYPTNTIGTRNPKWICSCECGGTKSVGQSSLRQGLTRSCGCLVIEKASVNGFKNIKKDTALNSLIRTYKASAKKRGLKFELTKDEFSSLTKQDYYYCDDPPKNIRIKPRRSISHLVLPYVYNGIDRVYNSIGYELYNCVPCCYHCNTMKMHFTKEEFLRKVKLIYQKLMQSNELIK